MDSLAPMLQNSVDMVKLISMFDEKNLVGIEEAVRGIDAGCNCGHQRRMRTSTEASSCPLTLVPIEALPGSTKDQGSSFTANQRPSALLWVGTTSFNQNTIECICLNCVCYFVPRENTVVVCNRNEIAVLFGRSLEYLSSSKARKMRGKKQSKTPCQVVNRVMITNDITKTQINGSQFGF